MIDRETQMMESRGIGVSAQRLAIARYVLNTDTHPSADEVWARVHGSCPGISRATVYNTLNLLVEKGLLRPFALGNGRKVFDRNTTPHHHFVDEETGEVHDIPADSVDVGNLSCLDGFAVSDYHLVIRGRRVRPN